MLSVTDGLTYLPFMLSAMFSIRWQEIFKFDFGDLFNVCYVFAVHVKWTCKTCLLRSDPQIGDLCSLFCSALTSGCSECFKNTTHDSTNADGLVFCFCLLVCFCQIAPGWHLYLMLHPFHFILDITFLMIYPQLGGKA